MIVHYSSSDYEQKTLMIKQQNKWTINQKIQIKDTCKKINHWNPLRTNLLNQICDPTKKSSILGIELRKMMMDD